MTPNRDDPAGTSRKHLAAEIDRLVGEHLNDELLGTLVRQALSLRYYDSAHDRLNGVIFDEVQRHTRWLIGEWLREHQLELFEGVVARLNEAHLAPMAAVITDDFIGDLLKAGLLKDQP